jgi:predicted RNA polymerase sigma factor
VTDHLRAEAARRNREQLVVSLVPPDEQVALALDAEPAGEGDDTLDLLFMCCHPACGRRRPSRSRCARSAL